MKSILPFFLILFFCFQFSEMRAELPNERKFVEDVLHIMGKKEKDFEKRTGRILNGVDISTYEVDSAHYIYIPVVFSTKKLTKVCRTRFFNKDSLLFYLDAKSISYDETLVCDDSIILGTILPFNYSYRFRKDRRNFLYPLGQQIMKIKPDVIFRIYNIPECYWFIKNKKLYAISYRHTDSGVMEDVEVYDASLYVRDIVDEENLCFMYHKEVVVIGR